MTIRLEAAGPRSNVQVSHTAQRTTAAPARPFQELVRASASAIVASAEQAATRLPGGPILAAAIRPVAGTADPVTGGGTNVSPEGPTGTAAQGIGNPASAGIEGALSSGSADITHYLKLQDTMNRENQRFTAFSNILKARHETVKNAITNIR